MTEPTGAQLPDDDLTIPSDYVANLFDQQINLVWAR